MLSDAQFIALSDLRFMLRRRETWLWTFVLPVVFFYFVGTITSRFGVSQPADALAVLVPSDAGLLADRLIGGLEKLGYRVVRVADEAALAKFSRRLSIPAGFTGSVLSRNPVKIEFSRKDTSAAGEYDRVRLTRAAYTLLADVIVVSKDGSTPDAQSLARLDAKPRLLALETKQAGARKQIPSGFEQAVPGSMAFFLLLVLMTTGGVTLIIEREQGILRRLASAPISRGAVVLGKWGARMLLAALQIAFCMITGSVLFHVQWGSHVPAILLVLFMYASLAAATGMLIGVFARSRPQAGALGSIAANVLACIGGCWWPAEIMPRAMQTFARFTPAGAVMDALHQLINFGASPAAVVWHIVGLACAAMVAGVLTARWFRYQ